DANTDRRMRAEKLARLAVGPGDGGERLLLGYPARGIGGPQRLKRALADAKTALALQFLHQLRRRPAVAPVGVEERALEVRGDLDVHGGRERGLHPVGRV